MTTSQLLSTRQLRRGSPLVCTILGAVVSMFGCSAEKPTHPKASDVDQMWDAGVILSANNTKLSHRFVVKNNFDHPIKITGTQKSCGCASAKMEKRELQSDEETTLDIEIDIPRTAVKKRVSVVLLTDDQKKPNWTYAISYESIPTISISPNRFEIAVKNLGDNSLELNKSLGFIEMYSHSNSNKSLQSVENTPSVLSVPNGLSIKLSKDFKVDEPRPGIIRRSYKFELWPSKSKIESGVFSGEVHFQNIEGQIATAVVNWKVDGSFSVTPRTIHFGLISAENAIAERQVTIRSNDNKAFHIVDILDNQHQVVVKNFDELTKKHSSVHELTLSYAFSESFKGYTATGLVILKTDMSDMEFIQIPWSVFMRPQSTGK
jgi:hypothetical protein